MKKPYRETNLMRAWAIGREAEPELDPADYGRFDGNRNFVAYDDPDELIFLPWEWVYMPEIVEYAIKCGIDIPDDTVDISRTF